jgi:hypothetical protein
MGLLKVLQTHTNLERDNLKRIVNNHSWKVKVKLSLCLIKYYTMKTYGGVEVELHYS